MKLLNTTIALTISLTTLASQSLWAQEETNEELPPYYGYLVAGVTGTTNYMVGGSTLSNNDPAIQPFMEYGAPFGGYIGAWASSGVYESYSDNKYEYDLYLGYRNNITDDLAYDLSYWKYYNDDTGYYGDAYFINLDYTVNDQVTTGLEIKRDEVLEAYLYKLEASYAVNDTWSVSGTYGINSRSMPYLTGDEEIWDLGVSNQLTPYLSVDLRAYGSNFDDVMTYKDEGTRFVLTVDIITELLN